MLVNEGVGDGNRNKGKEAREPEECGILELDGSKPLHRVHPFYR